MPDPKPKIFIVFGMPRSGTTLLERILGGHPLVSPGGEVVMLKGAARGAHVPGVAKGGDSAPSPPHAAPVHRPPPRPLRPRSRARVPTSPRRPGSTPRAACPPKFI